MTEPAYLGILPLAAVLHLGNRGVRACFHGEPFSQRTGEPKVMCEVIADRLEAYLADDEDDHWGPHLTSRTIRCPHCRTADCDARRDPDHEGAGL